MATPDPAEEALDRLHEVVKARRGTSNANQRGSAEDRRKRREWLVENYRANADLSLSDERHLFPVPFGKGIPATRCYRCGRLLWVETVTVDRIIPGCKGGTYRRNNIRPCCGLCNSETGGRARS